MITKDDTMTKLIFRVPSVCQQNNQKEFGIKILTGLTVDTCGGKRFTVLGRAYKHYEIGVIMEGTIQGSYHMIVQCGDIETYLTFIHNFMQIKLNQTLEDANKILSSLSNLDVRDTKVEYINHGWVY